MLPQTHQSSIALIQVQRGYSHLPWQHQVSHAFQASNFVTLGINAVPSYTGDHVQLLHLIDKKWTDIMKSNTQKKKSRGEEKIQFNHDLEAQKF